MNQLPTNLPGVVIIEPDCFKDERGYFMEIYNSHRYSELNIAGPFVQDNLSFSSRGILRGLHYQYPHCQGKLVSVLQGEVFDVAVDIRLGSPAFGQWTGVLLSALNRRQLYLPPGFAHGFCVMSATALFTYKCSDFYTPQAEGGIAWNDPDLAIKWPLADPVLSAKDMRHPRLKDIAPHCLPVWHEENRS
ncbi:MAG: dTDP-4-dehydrorhamnose 3,5-epimerase [Sporomusaceae bacterium]|nr:dTDP-4-dehydrorhamnose 3,5-epimerase [Sporomusaceae bacterium]